MDQRADRRGAFHRVGEPNVQRELRALSACAQQKQQTDRRPHAAANVKRRIAEHRLAKDAAMHDAADERIVEIERAVGDPEQEKAQGEAAIADAVDEERLHPRRRGRGLFKPEADQQIAAQTDRLPEDVEQNEVAHRHQHRHREDEQRDVAEEPPIAGVAVHIADRIDRHQQRNKRDHRQHDGGERIGAEDDVDMESPVPFPRERVRVRGTAAGINFKSPSPFGRGLG